MNPYDSIRRALNKLVSDGGSYTADVANAFAAVDQIEHELKVLRAASAQLHWDASFKKE